MPEQSSQPVVWIVARVFGASGQPWLWRQATHMTRVRPHVICWERRNEQTYPVGDLPVTVLRHDVAPYEGPSRWLHRLRNAPGGNFFASPGAERRELTRLLERTRPAAILCHFGDIAMRLLPLARRFDVPLVAHFHGIQQNLHDRWFRRSLSRALGEFAAIVVVGTAEREWLVRQGVEPARVHTIACGAPANVFRPRLGRTAGPIRFALASRLVEEKGVEISVQAFADMAHLVGGSELHVFGDGPLRGRLEGIAAARGLGARVVFHGYVGEQALAQRLPDFEVFVQHSLTMPDGWQEGFGVSVTEASACGLPVVVSACGGLLDQVVDGHNGLVVPQRDVGAMANAMVALASDPELRVRMGCNGRERVLKEYDTVRQIVRLEDAILNAVSRDVSKPTGALPVKRAELVAAEAR